MATCLLQAARSTSRVIAAKVNSKVMTLTTSAIVNKDYMMNDPLDHATGVEKYELLAKQAGNDNPFDTYTVKPEAGTGISANHPIIIPSTKSSRMIGCCCEDDFKQVVWFELEKNDQVQKCECGIHFKLVDYDPLDVRIKPKYGDGFGSGMTTIYY